MLEKKIRVHKNTLLHALLIALLILGWALFTPGYVMSFDMVWGPNLPISSSESNTYLLFTAIEALSIFIPSWIIQKIILAAIIVLSYLGALRLLRSLTSNTSFILQLVSLFYIFNPFFYTRLITGQWIVLMGYALLPWAINAFFTFIKTPSFKTAWPVAIWTTLVGLTSIHTIGIMLVAFVGLALYAGREKWKTKMKWCLAIAAAWCLLNITWLAPIITGQSTVESDISHFSTSEMQAFATHGTVLDSPPISALLLTGFWADDTNRYIIASNQPIWWIGALIFIALIITGIVHIIRTRNTLGYTFIGIGIVSWLLGIGIAWNVSAPITELLAHIMPYYNGYREPQKWLMLLAITYVYLAAVGALWLYARITLYKSTWLTYTFVTLLFVSPFLFSPALPLSASGQLRSVQYPAQWEEAKVYLNHHSTHDTNVLVLPWHMYMPVSFVGRVVGNPTGHYFDQHMITGNNFELEGVSDQRATPLTDYVKQLAEPGFIPLDISENLNRFNIRYILLLKEDDWKNYSWLSNQSSLTPVVTNDKLILYKVTSTQ